MLQGGAMFSSVKEYLEANFEGDANLNLWDEKKKLPLYLIKAYDYIKIEYYGKTFLAINCSDKEELGIDELKKHIKQIKKYTNLEHELVIIFNVTTRYMRSRLIREQISFIIPGKQIYFPTLGMVYSEKLISKYRLDRVYTSETKMRPATQALFLELVLNRKANINQSTLAKKLNISRMSISRAFKELKSMNLIKDTNEDGVVNIKFSEHIIEVWQKAQDYIVNPILKKVYVIMDSIDNELWDHLIISGESALSRFSMLGEPKYKTYGITNKEWNALDHKPQIVEVKDDRVCIIELWKHKLPVNDNIIHPLSLLVLLASESDERIINELEYLEESIEWEEL